MACNTSPNPPPPPHYGTQQEPFTISGTTALANLPWVKVLQTSQPLGPVKAPFATKATVGMTAWVQFQLPPPYPQAVGPTVFNPYSPGPKDPNAPGILHPNGTQFSVGEDGLPFLFSNRSQCILPYGGTGENPIVDDPSGTIPPGPTTTSDALPYKVLEWSTGMRPKTNLQGVFGAKIFVEFPNDLVNIDNVATYTSDTIYTPNGGTLICGCGSGCPPP